MTGFAHAAEPLTLGEETAGPYSLQPHMTMLADRGEALDLADVKSVAARGEFRPLPAAGANFGFTDATIWLRFEVQARADGHYVVEVPYALLDRAILHVPKAPKPAQRRQGAGDRHSFTARPIDYRRPAFPLELRGGESVTAYLEIASSGAVQAPARLWRADAFQSRARESAYVLGPYFGVLAAMMAYNVLLFALARDRNTLYYVAAIGLVGLFVVSYTGIGFQFLWPSMPGWNDIAPVLFAILANLASLQFSRSFLNLAERVLWGDRLLKVLMGVSAALAIATPLLPPRPAAVLVTLTLIVTIGAILVTAVLAWRRGGRQARYFLAAWGIFLTAALMTALSLEGLLPASAATQYAVPVGSAIEMIVLGIALADRMRLLQEEKERIQAEAMRRLIRELHDGMGRHFIKLMRELDDERTPRGHMRTDLRRAYVDMRLLVSSTDPPFRDLATGLATVREQYDNLLDDNGLRWDWRVALEAGCLQDRPGVVLNVLRIVQEALTNALKHANATVLTVAAEQRADGSIRLTVDDNGEGDQDNGRNSGGIEHMQQRANEHGFHVTRDKVTCALRVDIPTSAQ